MKLVTEQESFWAGEFGDSYCDRNAGEFHVANNRALFAQILRNIPDVKSVIEFGANVGLNLQAIHSLLPTAALTGVEINAKAVTKLEQLGFVEAVQGSFLEFEEERQFDLVFTKGVLIHINPEFLSKCYRIMHDRSAKYICIAEYYSPRPVEVEYRGHSHRLFKRDFAGEMIDEHPDLSLIDYGFAYHRGAFPQDDINWFLLRKD